MSLKVKHKGNFDNLEVFLKKAPTKNFLSILKSYGEEGVRALSQATPVDSGETASLWTFAITATKTGYSLGWFNLHETPLGVPIAILIEYGHATRNGSYVQGREFINAALKPVFEKISEALWKEVNT